MLNKEVLESGALNRLETKKGGSFCSLYYTSLPNSQIEEHNS